MTGVQFSLPLIDFGRAPDKLEVRWGSVLITPDRLRLAAEPYDYTLGFSSHYP